jgi:hypothetical protein
MRCTWHVAHTGKKRSVYRVLLGKLEGNRPLGRLRYGLEDNIKMDIIGWSGIDWIRLAQYRD